MNKPKIYEITYGIAYQVTDGKQKYIEVNKYLKEDPVLYEHIIKHEIEHMESKNKHMDFMMDVKQMLKFKHGARLFRFCIRHPKAFLCYSPILFDDGGVGINLFALILNISILFIVGLALFILWAYITY